MKRSQAGGDKNGRKDRVMIRHTKRRAADPDGSCKNKLKNNNPFTSRGTGTVIKIIYTR